MSLKIDVLANYVGQAWRAAMNLVFVPMYIEYLGMEAYGVVGFFALLQTWLLLLDVGMRPTLAREMARFLGGAHDPQSIRNLLRSVEYVASGVSILLVSIVFIGSDWLASGWLSVDSLSIDTVARSIQLMGVVISLRFIENLYLSCLTGLRRMVLLNMIMSIMATIRGGGAVIVLAFLSSSLDAFFIFQGLVSFVTVLLYLASVYWTLPRRSARFSTQELSKVWRFASGMTMITVLAVVLTQIDKLLLTRLLNLRDFGYYTLAALVANGLTMISSPITLAYYPRLTELMARDEHENLVNSYHQGAQLVSVLMGSASAVLYSFSEQIIWVWTGDREVTQNVFEILAILALGNGLNGMMQMPYQLQLAAGWTSLVVKVNTLAVALLIPSVLVLVPTYGPYGAAWAWVGLNILYIVVQIGLMHRRLLPDEMWYWYVWDFGLPLTMSYITALGCSIIVPEGLGRVETLVAVAISSLCVLIGTVLAAPLARGRVLRLCCPNL